MSPLPQTSLRDIRQTIVSHSQHSPLPHMHHGNTGFPCLGALCTRGSCFSLMAAYYKCLEEELILQLQKVMKILPQQWQEAYKEGNDPVLLQLYGPILLLNVDYTPFASIMAET